MKQRNTLENLDGIDSELEVISCIESLKINKSGWSNTRVAFMSFDLSKDKTKGRSSYVELPLKDLSLSYIQKKIDRLCGI